MINHNLPFIVDPGFKTNTDKVIGSKWINANCHGIWKCIYDGRPVESPLYAFQLKADADGFKRQFHA